MRLEAMFHTLRKAVQISQNTDGSQVTNGQ